MISDAKKEDPWKEPIKDLIDQYADLAEKNEKHAQSEKEETIQQLLKAENKNNYGSTKPKVPAPEQKAKETKKAKVEKRADVKQEKSAQPDEDDKGSNVSKLMAAMERTAKKEYEKQEKKARVEAPKEEEAISEDQGEAIAKSMLDEFLDEQQPKPAASPKRAKKVSTAQKKVSYAQKQPKKAKYDPKVKAHQKQILTSKLSKHAKEEDKPENKEFENENPQNNQFALITLLAQKINVKVTPAILELQGADQIEQLTSTLINTAIENGTEESVIEKAVDELH